MGLTCVTNKAMGPSDEQPPPPSPTHAEVLEIATDQSFGKAGCNM